MSRRIPSTLREWWFGAVPEDWRAVPLKHLCDRSSLYGANIPAEMYESDGVRFLRTTDIGEDGTLGADGVFVPRELVAESILAEGDFLISRSGTVGRGFVYRETDGPCSYAGYLVRYVLNDKRSASWLFYVTKSAPFAVWLGASAIEATIGNVNGEKYANLVLPVPPFEFQRAISDFLDRETARLDALVTAKQRVLGLLAEKRKALIAAAVTRGLDPQVKLRESGVPWLGEIPGHWELWKVGHLAKVGNGSTPERDKVAYWSGGSFPWLNSSVVNQEEVTSSDQFVTDAALRQCHLPRLRPGTVLVAITGQGKTRGQAVVLSIEATINQHIAFVAPDPPLLDAWFLRWTFYRAYDYLRSISDDAGGTKGALTCEDVAGLNIPLPPPDEQRTIVAHIARETAKLDAVRAATERTITLLKERRSALIAAAVTGQLDVGAAA
ncbi:MAG: restriction endonuclease subunit S [Deltaproteobacteria bacterium]|nr:restriction endonuclease subunit S [Deltaproteobacteria bacterium]